MISEKHSFIANKNLLNKLWIMLGGVLGILFSLIVVTERSQNSFPQLGVFEKILNVVAVGFCGIAITSRCKPTKQALIGGVVFPILLMVELSLTSSPNSISAGSMIGWIAAGILAGILAGTAWLGAIIGTLIMAFFVIVVAPITRGTTEVGWGWIFIPMGAITGSLVQLSFNIFRGKRPARAEQKVPEWLQQKDSEKENKTSKQ